MLGAWRYYHNRNEPPQSINLSIPESWGLVSLHRILKILVSFPDRLNVSPL